MRKKLITIVLPEELHRVVIESSLSNRSEVIRRCIQYSLDNGIDALKTSKNTF